MYIYLEPGLQGLLLFFFSVDHTRVFLHDGEPEAVGSDYINANKIVVSCFVVVVVSIFSEYCPF